MPTNIAKWIPIPFQISALIGLQIWTRVSNKFNRITALNYGAALWIISCTAALFLPSLTNFSGDAESLFLNVSNIIFFLILIFIICLIGIVDKDNFNIVEQCISAQLTIRLCIGLIPSVLVIIGLLIMRKWDQKLITN